MRETWEKTALIAVAAFLLVVMVYLVAGATEPILETISPRI
jgi:hypothetical protein